MRVKCDTNRKGKPGPSFMLSATREGWLTDYDGCLLSISEWMPELQHSVIQLISYPLLLFLATIPIDLMRAGLSAFYGRGTKEIVMVYPQMPPLTEHEINSFLEQVPLVTLCTHNKDGTIHAAPVWFKYESGKVLVGTQVATRRARNIKRDPKVTLVIDSDQLPYKAVLAYGRAELDYENVIRKRVSIFEKYMPKENAEKLANALPGVLGKPVIIRVSPSKFVSYDYGKDPTGLFK